MTNQDDDEQVQLLIDALVPRPIPWNNHWVCKVRNVPGLGIGKTPAEAHEDYHRPKERKTRVHRPN